MLTALNPLQFQCAFVSLSIPHIKPIHLKRQKDIKHAQQILNEQQNSLQESCPRVPQILWLWLWEVLGFQTHFSSSQTSTFLSEFFGLSSMCSEFASIQSIWMKNSDSAVDSSSITRLAERTEQLKLQGNQSSLPVNAGLWCSMVHAEVYTSCRYCGKVPSVIHWLDETFIYLRLCDVSGGGVHITHCDWLNEWMTEAAWGIKSSREPEKKNVLA